jgi:hypothetical protein
MSMFNKKGVEFTNLVKVPLDPNSPPPTYSHKFPVVVGNKVTERWSTKVRPMKDMTRLLSGCKLKRNIDYMVGFNGKDYEYWFHNSNHALMFAIITSGMIQSFSTSKRKFDIMCPHCNTPFPTEKITWC